MQPSSGRLGHTVVPFGSVASATEAPWVEVAEIAGRAVADGDCDQGVFCCWTGTGISMAANKLAGIRAALCTDPGTARGAREWNDANVLCLSNRLVSGDMAREILAAWFSATPDARAIEGIERMRRLDRTHRGALP